jgi:hypothetical protein
LLLVIESEAEEVTEGGEGAFGGVGFGFFQGAFMRFAQAGTATVTDPAAIPIDQRFAGADPDAHPRSVGAGLGIEASLLIYAFG